MQSDIPDDVMMHAERLYDEGGYKTVPQIIAEAIMAERCEAALSAAEPQPTPPVAVKDLHDAAKRLLERWDNFNAGNANYEEAYNNLAKYAREDWEALRATLSTGADPVGKVEVHYAYCCPGSTKYCDCVNKNHGTAWIGSNEVGEDYMPVTPPAPSVAVKALEAAIEELDRISCVPFVTETRDTYAQLELAKAYADRGSVAAQKALASLSAQVQDVSRDLPSEFEKWWDDAGHYVGGVVKMTYTQRKQLAWDAFYAAAAPAAPAKQEGTPLQKKVAKELEPLRRSIEQFGGSWRLTKSSKEK